MLAGLAGLKAPQVADLVVAYEPIWAIGTGQTATPEDAQEMCGTIRSVVRSRWGAEAADSIRIQYGGSVKPVNAPDLMRQSDIDGALVGGASLDADEFARITKLPLIPKSARILLTSRPSHVPLSMPVSSDSPLDKGIIF